MSSIGILNVGAGDTKLSFDKNNPAERIRAARIVKDMLRRGYALLIEIGKNDDGSPKYTRALDFDENTCEYIIADFDPVAAAEHDESEKEDGQECPRKTAEAPQAGPKKRGRKPKVRSVPAESATGVAVARTAGG